MSYNSKSNIGSELDLSEVERCTEMLAHRGR